MRAAAQLRSVVEWVVAAAVLFGLGWMSSDLVRSWTARRAELVIEVSNHLPPAVPPGSISVPFLLLVDGREVRKGMTQPEFEKVISSRDEVGERYRTAGAFGPRITKAYNHFGTRFFVTLEQTERHGAVRVTGIYLP
jgi:hypothetical protein